MPALALRGAGGIISQASIATAASKASNTCNAGATTEMIGASVASLLLLERHAVHVGLAQLEAGTLVEAVRGLTRRTRRQIDGASADLLRVLDGCLHEGETSTLTGWLTDHIAALGTGGSVPLGLEVSTFSAAVIGSIIISVISSIIAAMLVDRDD